MLYATKTGTAPAAVTVFTAFVTAVKMSPLQPPNHCACEPLAILSICAASAGRVARHESAVFLAFEYGFTQKVAPAIGFPVTGIGVGVGSGVGGGGGGVTVPPFLCFASAVVSGEVASLAQAARVARVVAMKT